MTVGTLIATKTVLVADDTAFVRDRFRTAIETAGHRAVAVRTRAELLDHLREPGAIDLIVLDLRLPGGRGLHLLRSISKAGLPAPPVVVFSGTIANADEVRELTGAGVAGFVNEYTAAQHIMPSLGPHLFPDNYNRRSSPRVAAALPVSYRVGNAIAAGLTLNISKGGMAIRATGPLAAGTELKLRFRLPAAKKDIEAEARVAWSHQRVGMGLQFTRLDAGDERAIEQFADAHFFSNRKA